MHKWFHPLPPVWKFHCFKLALNFRIYLRLVYEIATTYIEFDSIYIYFQQFPECQVVLKALPDHLGLPCLELLQGSEGVPTP